MPMSKDFSAANQFQEPFMHGSDGILHVVIRQTDPTLNATFTLQSITGRQDPSRPSDADPLWTKAKEYAVGSEGVSDSMRVGRGWYRIAILTGDYVSGEANGQLTTG